MNTVLLSSLSPDLPEESHTYIGVVVSVCGNILISVALNLQKYAHNKLQERANVESNANGSLPYTSPETANGIYDHDRCYNNYQKANPESDNTDYLKSKLWWMGITLMVIGEIGNFVAYGFAPASTIAPLGTTTLVSNVILAPLLLKERFRFRDIVGMVFAVFGATIVVLSSKSEEIKASHPLKSLSPDLVIEYLTSMEAIIYYSVTGGLILILTGLSPRWGSKSILIDLGLVALYGAYTVLSTKSVSSLLSLTFYKMFAYPVSYVLFLVLVLTAVIQIKYLNKALQRFDATAVIPTQFVLFTVSAIIGSAVLYRDFDDVNAQQMARFGFGCILEFLGVYLITANRRRNDIQLSDEEDTLSSHGRDSRPSSIRSNDPAEPYAVSVGDDGDRDTDTLYSHGGPDVPATDTTPLLGTTSLDRHKTDDHSTHGHGTERPRRTSVFKGISLVSQLASMGDDRYEGTNQLSTSQSSKRDKAIHAVGHLLGGIIPGAKHTTSEGDSSTAQNDSVPIEILSMHFTPEVPSDEAHYQPHHDDNDITTIEGSGGIQLRKSSTSLRSKREEDALSKQP